MTVDFPAALTPASTVTLAKSRVSRVKHLKSRSSRVWSTEHLQEHFLDHFEPDLHVSGLECCEAHRITEPRIRQQLLCSCVDRPCFFLCTRALVISGKRRREHIEQCQVECRPLSIWRRQRLAKRMFGKDLSVHSHACRERARSLFADCRSIFDDLLLADHVVGLTQHAGEEVFVGSIEVLTPTELIVREEAVDYLTILHRAHIGVTTDR